LLAPGSGAAWAAKIGARSALIERLIRDSRALPKVSQRIDFISGKLLGIRYQANTLIGGPKHPEKFVVRDDAFDCVTFCEVVSSELNDPELERGLVQRVLQFQFEVRDDVEAITTTKPIDFFPA